jgi:hypothetical protein
MMNYDFPLWEPSRNYACPEDVTPVWREAYESGFDMADIEESLKLSPEERLANHDRKLNDFLKREKFFDMMRRGRDLILRIESSRNKQTPNQPALQIISCPY